MSKDDGAIVLASPKHCGGWHTGGAAGESYAAPLPGRTAFCHRVHYVRRYHYRQVAHLLITTFMKKILVFYCNLDFLSVNMVVGSIVIRGE